MTEQEKLRELEKRLWAAADQLRANSSLAASRYSMPVLGLIFLRYADVRFTQVENELAGKSSGRCQIGKADYQAKGVMYVPETARFSHLKSLPEGADIGQALNRAMETIETANPDLQGVLPSDYGRFDNPVLAEPLLLIGSIPDDIEGDAFGKIYEYFLGNSAMTEEQQRHVREELTEEKLTVFDLLTKPEPSLTKSQETKLKKVVREVLEKLKQEVLVLDWKNHQATRAAVQVAIQDVLDDGLPDVYDRAMFSNRTGAIFEHAFTAYQGNGKSIYEEAA